MPVKHFIDKANEIIVTTWEGSANDADLIKAMRAYQEDIQGHPDNVNYNELLDFSEVSDIDVTIEGVKSVGRIAAETDQENAHRKLAIVAPTNLTYYFARMYKTLRSLPRKSSKDVKIFTDTSDAAEWLKDS